MSLNLAGFAPSPAQLIIIIPSKIEDITRSIKTGGAAALGGSFCCGVIVIEVRDGDGLCRIGAGPLGWRGPP